MSMEDEKKQVYTYCSSEEEIFSFAWRSAFLAKICDIQVPDDVSVRVIKEEEKAMIQSEPYSEALAHLLIMFGSGYISYENLCKLTRDAADYKDEIFAAESFIIAESNKDEKERVSEDIIQRILLCTINSKKYPEIQTVGFDTARKLCESTHTVIHNGFVFVLDVGFLTQLLNADEPMGSFTAKNTIKISGKEQIINDFKDNSIIEKSLNVPENEMPDMPFVINLNNTFYIQQIYDRPYAVEFIHYAKDSGIPFDENFVNEYTAYVRRHKRKLSVSAISRKREICGDEVNWFDYGTTKYADKRIEIGSSFDCTEIIDLAQTVADDADMSDDELTELAANTFIQIKKLADRTVIEVTFCGKKKLFLYMDGKIGSLESEKFRRIPFDYNNVWTTVMEWSRSKLIQKKGSSIVVPDSEMKKLALNDRKYAQRMIEEQYSLKKGSNKMLQKLSELKSYAKKELDIKAQQAKLKNERDAGITEEGKK